MASSDLSPDAAPAARAPLSALRPLLPAVMRYRGRMLAAFIALIVASAATLLLPIAVRRVIDAGFGTESYLVNGYFAALIGVAGLLAAASSARFYLVMTLGERVVADIRAQVFGHIAHLDPGFFDRTKSGELVSRLSADTTQLKSAFGASASIALRNLLLFFGAAIMMVLTSPKLSALVLGAIPFIVLPLLFSGRSVRRRAKQAQDRLAETSAYAVEAIGAVRTMQAFGAEASTAAAYAAAAEDAYGAARDSTKARAWLTGVGLFLVSASVVGVLWYGAQDVLSGEMSGGRLAQFVIYAIMAASGLGQLGEVWGEVSQAAGAAARLAEILATEPAIKAPAQPVAMPVPARGAVAFEHVRFAYPTAPERSSLEDVSFEAKAGETLAVVGPSGAGKSTIVQLLLRFYDPQSGRILVDGVPIIDADPAELRTRIAYVPQEPAIFGATIAENIAYGREGASAAEIERAAQMAAADEFIRTLPQGYATKLGERGVTLSGGQRQRIAIARAILRDAPILLLDEATSALDAESERAVQRALETLMKDRTTIVVAHRLATILSADRILVLDHGRIVEQGSHESLVKAGGLYARLAALQFDQARFDAQAA
ncbi:ABC transporter transmembrane domain-containing protein [Terrarubrum flagellatum]|uniref:ABC transporter transmembrane domain-containing protein n=1 Tax=Terrirubrum flagellatum TaxID=2895980 RepID=UPI003144F953